MTEHTPPQDVANAAKRALDWIDEGKAGSGFTDTGKHRAHQLANRDALSAGQIKKMQQYFKRHVVDRDTEGFHRGEAGYPTPGRVAWDAWGGEPARTWVNRQKFRDL
ncbi:hypothetical protein [Nesterenkonia natronophila]|uniref:Uncharacterized protein n=1 Tax=Nesterenkonia natronophila TaxID=2174932 RepID=A0A3A4F682_9MICC|nr:hypothetical protein [Nesterenkonia natronophila]RJN31990.1 hypothetical protein D3250_07770 [Nesterenkonia natronophila]